MIPLTHAFEIGYGPSFEVLDHSELFLDCVPGTPPFSKISPGLEGKLNADQRHELKQMTELFARIERSVTQASDSTRYQVGSVEFTVTWQRPLERVGIVSVLASGKVASVSLLMCRDDDREIHEQRSPWTSALSLFMKALRDVAPMEPDSIDQRKFRLVNITRRPLLASIFLPPFTPMDDSVVRTIQMQLAYAFFLANGELEIG